MWFRKFMTSLPQCSYLDFKHLTEADLEKFAPLACDDHIKEFLMEGQDLSTEEQIDFIRNGESILSRTGLGIYLVFANHVVVGYCGFMETHPPSKDLNIVYAFKSSYTGQGLATRVCNALVAFYRDSEFAGGLTAVVHPRNMASIKVLEKAGFTHEGSAEGDLQHLLRYRLQS